MESQTEETSQTFGEREQKLAELQGEVAVIETLTTRLQECKQELVRFEIRQGKWKDRERFLELKVRDYKKQIKAQCGDDMERESAEAVIKESSAETERSIDRQSGRVPEQIVDLQKVIEHLKQELRMNKSKEHDFEKERERFSTREKELEMKIQVLERPVTELHEKAPEDCPQRETVDKPCREMEVQTDITMQTFEDMAAEVKDLQDEFNHLTHSLQSAGLNFNKERAEWREQRQDLEERATVSESKKSNQKECDELKEESLKEHSAKYHAMEQKVIVLEKERDSLEKTVALLKEESTQKDEVARRQQDKSSTSETPTVDLDSITLQQLDKMEMPRVRALVDRLHSQCSQRADALEEECERLSEIAQTLSGKLKEHETNEVRLEAESKEFKRRAIEAETQQQAEQMKQREDDALHRISELTETKERLETALEEAREKNKDHTAKEEQWTEAKEKLLSQIEFLRVTKDFNQSKKERKGFFSRVFGRRN